MAYYRITEKLAGNKSECFVVLDLGAVMDRVEAYLAGARPEVVHSVVERSDDGKSGLLLVAWAKPIVTYGVDECPQPTPLRRV